MPQMSPLGWMFLYIFFIMLYFMFCVKIYFKYSAELYMLNYSAWHYYDFMFKL